LAGAAAGSVPGAVEPTMKTSPGTRFWCSEKSSEAVTFGISRMLPCTTRDSVGSIRSVSAASLTVVG
jgi:hypothetical protein